MAPGYLTELCKPVANIDGHRHLRSAGRGQLDVPRVRLSTYGGHAFCYAGPSAWNALPDFFKKEYTFSGSHPFRLIPFPNPNPNPTSGAMGLGEMGGHPFSTYF